MALLSDILTGADNRTVAIGRWMGVVLLAIGVIVIVAEPFSVVYKKLSIDQWVQMLAQWQVFLPVLCATAGALIAGTAFTEPKAKKDDGNG